MQEKLTKRTFRGALCITLGSLAGTCGAVTLGEAQVRSALGEPLDVVVPLKTAAGESIERSCFSMLRDNEAGLPGIGDGSVSIERRRGGASLRMRSFAAVNEPAVAVKLRASCPGSTEPEFTREYVLLLDPRPAGAAPSLAEEPGAATATPPRGILATFLARLGDTLESLARAIVPRSRPAQRDYIAAMRAANPALQSLGESDPIPEGTPVALPDLRVSAPRSSRPQPAREAAPADPPATPVAPAARERAAARPAPAATAPRESARARSAESPPAPRLAPRQPGFVLRLSAPEVDISRTSRFDEAARQKLRERQLVLDADDQVSALLAMRNSLKQLETRVAELQLKLAAMPPSLAGLTPPPERAPQPSVATPAAPVPAPAPAPAAVAAADPVPAPATAAAPAPAIAETSAPPQPAAPAPAVEPPTSPAPQAAAPAAPAAASPQVAAPDATRRPAARAVPRSGTADDGATPWWWALVAVLVALALWLALRLARRRRLAEEEYGETRMIEPGIGLEAPAEEVPQPAPEPQQAAARLPDRPALASDAPLATRLAENSGELRRRYIEERFPEIANGAIVLDDPASVVKGARLFYEDGALPRAVELLQFAIEDRPHEVKPWLALFEIFRLERLTGEYAELATRFQARHGQGEHWRKVRFFGREIDPGNPLYREDAINTLETIGPREARRVAAATASYDPIAENWLAAPMDFENEVLANDLRRALMAGAKLRDQDLAPNPMPALRNVEMFTVA